MLTDFRNDSLWLMQGNCLERMKEIQDGSVDAVICDPPFNTTSAAWDKMVPLEDMWKQLKRVIKPYGVILLHSTQPFTTKLASSNLEQFKYSLYWKKSKASNFPHAPNMPLKIIEEILMFTGGVVGHISQAGHKRSTYNPQGIREGSTVVKQSPNTSELKYHRESQSNHKGGYKCKAEGYPTSLLEFKSENGFHPTQKPIALMEYLIKTYTNEGETVLDFTMGSGTTGVAAVNLNRSFIGIEMDEGYFEISKNRILEASDAN